LCETRKSSVAAAAAMGAVGLEPFRVGYKEMIIIHEELELLKLFALCCNEQQQHHLLLKNLEAGGMVKS
jgi:hypothetical protein